MYCNFVINTTIINFYAYYYATYTLNALNVSMSEVLYCDTYNYAIRLTFISRMIDRIGCKNPKDYIDFLSFAEKEMDHVRIL